jgi:hypothetical protein
MYGLVKFEENDEGFSVAEASAVMIALEGLGTKIEFADDILELIAMAGGEVTNPEEYEEYKGYTDERKLRYEAMRRDLNSQYVGLDGWAHTKNRVQAHALVNIAESLEVISGTTR